MPKSATDVDDGSTIRDNGSGGAIASGNFFCNIGGWDRHCGSTPNDRGSPLSQWMAHMVP